MGSHRLVTMFKTVTLTLLLCVLVDSSIIIEGGRRGRRSSPDPPVDMAHCRNGRERSCECTDGSRGNMTRRPCPPDSNVDQNTCVCPEGYLTGRVPGRSYGLHKICTAPNGDTTRSTCKCSDGTNADWTQHPCDNGAYIKGCTCLE